MMLSEQIQVSYSKELASICHKAKNLYNIANFNIRQFYFNLEEHINYYDLQVILKKSGCYKDLPAQTSQQILKLVDKNWKSFFRAIREWKKNKNRFLGRPKPPRYKKKNGESIVVFTNQNTRIKNGFVYFPKKCNLKPIKTRIEKYQQVRIVPKGNYYVVEVIYEKEEIDLGLDKNKIVAIDLGVENLLTTANNVGLRPLIVKGKVIKSVNQYYNKKGAYYQSINNKNENFSETRRLQRLTKRRDNKIRDYFHKTSRSLINYCVENDIGTIIIGYNELWKQSVNLGKKNNQKFVSIPFRKLVNQIQYKSKLIGIKVTLTDENYTSKCSALDLEEIKKHESYLGRRIKRGLFKSSDGKIINADVNGALNIMRKVVPKAFANGIEAVVLQPQIVKIN